MAIKDTLRLPVNQRFQTNGNLTIKEPQLIDEVLSLSQRLTRGKTTEFVVHDGPPYANGPIHMGHAINKMIKDFAAKFAYFSGLSVEFRPGWDCHGLPIEKLAESQNINGETVTDFRNRCRNIASETISSQISQLKTLGICANFDSPYLTMSTEYEFTILKAFQKLKDDGYIYRSAMPVPWCVTNKTSLSNSELYYKQETEESWFVCFPTNLTEIEGFLIWTTTPWTIPLTDGVACNINEKYVVGILNGRKYIVSHQASLKLDLRIENDIDIRSSLLSVFHPLDTDKSLNIFLSDDVDISVGTGCLHVASSCGMEDYKIAGGCNLSYVDHDSCYNANIYNIMPELSGVNVLSQEAKSLITEKLSTLLVSRQSTTHSVAYCERSDSRIIYRSLPQWFMRIDDTLKDKVQDMLSETEFYPLNAKNNLLKMLESRPDWCLSRQRSWGVPIPCDFDDSGMYISSSLDKNIQHLEMYGIDEWWNISDNQEVLDVWFDSGLSWHTSSKKSDLYIEGNDQHRGWFQSSIWLSAALNNKIPSNRFVTHGFVVDENGNKMSKSKGNVVDPINVANKYGTEVLRLWSATTDYRDEMRVGDNILTSTARIYKDIRNILKFLISVIPESDPGDIKHLDNLDVWIATEFNIMFDIATKHFKQQEFWIGIDHVIKFMKNELSAIYLSSIKDSLYCDQDSELLTSHQLVIGDITKKLIVLLSPFLTHTSLEAYSFLPNWVKKNHQLYDEILNPIDIDMPDKLGDNFKIFRNAFYKNVSTLSSDTNTLKLILTFLPKSWVPEVANIENLFGVSLFEPYNNEKILSTLSLPFGTYHIIEAGNDKCERCWKYLKLTTHHGHQLCKRCVPMVNEV